LSNGETSTGNGDGGLQLKRSLGLPAAIAIVVGSMLGIGIFIIPPEVAGLTQNIGLFFGVWITIWTALLWPIDAL
jgi:amino acid transporter